MALLRYSGAGAGEFPHLGTALAQCDSLRYNEGIKEDMMCAFQHSDRAGIISLFLSLRIPALFISVHPVNG